MRRYIHKLSELYNGMPVLAQIGLISPEIVECVVAIARDTKSKIGLCQNKRAGAWGSDGRHTFNKHYGWEVLVTGDGFLWTVKTTTTFPDLKLSYGSDTHWIARPDSEFYRIDKLLYLLNQSS